MCPAASIHPNKFEEYLFYSDYRLCQVANNKVEQKIWGVVLSLLLCAAVRLYKWNQVLSVSTLLCVR